LYSLPWVDHKPAGRLFGRYVAHTYSDRGPTSQYDGAIQRTEGTAFTCGWRVPGQLSCKHRTRD
jgi:hypothetical protein